MQLQQQLDEQKAKYTQQLNDEKNAAEQQFRASLAKRQDLLKEQAEAMLKEWLQKQEDKLKQKLQD